MKIFIGNYTNLSLTTVNSLNVHPKIILRADDFATNFAGHTFYFWEKNKATELKLIEVK